jgi:hypothetical protein
MKTDVSENDRCKNRIFQNGAFKNGAFKSNAPADKQQSLSMLMTLGVMLANGARADARDSRERVRRQLERMEKNFARQGDSSGSDAH